MLELLGTAGCHLCDDAERVLEQWASVSLGAWHSRDIALDESLCQQFGEHIPVLRYGEHEQLFWPFSVLDVDRFLAQCITKLK